MKLFTLIFLITLSSIGAQTIDYNLKKGYIANGYDVVSYFNNAPLEGTKKFVFKYHSVTYKFASKENLAVFKNDPKKYSPQYGGYCAYAVAVKGSKVSVNPETFQIKDGKLYLFYNAWGTNTLELWQNEDEQLLKEKADKNWEHIKFKK